jgi:integrase
MSQSQQTSTTSLAKYNFMSTCKSPATQYTYLKGLSYFMDYVKVDREDFAKLLDKDPKLIQMDICQFITEMSKKIAPATLCTYVAAIRKFYAMNDLVLNWEKIHSFEPEPLKVSEDRPYNHSEIKQLVEHANLRNRAVVLLMSSTGIRLGALPYLRVKDLEHIEKYNVYKINVYAKTRQKYFTFCTPEAATCINQYLDWRKRLGEHITEESLLFRSDFNTQRLDVAKPITTRAISTAIGQLWVNIGMKKQHLETHGYERNEVMTSHGFRKFFETEAFRAGMDHMYLRRLLGQSSGLEDSYLKLSEEELLLGDSKHIGYVGIIDQLTINEENRLKEKVRVLEIEKSKIDSIREEFAELKKSIGLQ